jgi:glutamyl-tRNA synthetase
MDDADAGVTHIVRGDDLTDSTPRQLLIYEALSLGPIPQYWHLPMVIGEDGHRLAKRHGDTRIGQFRSAGISPGRVLQLLARWCGMNELGDIRTAADLVKSFDIDRVPRHPVIFTAADDAWLMEKTNA